MLSLSRTVKYCTKLADEVMKLKGEKCLMDFKILVKDDEFPCTKFIMAAHSPMLHAMLTSDMAEVAKQEVRLDHISEDIIQIILDYMYCEDVSFHKDQLMPLIAAADYLQMTELKEMCLDEVPHILEPGNVISWWKEAAKMNYDNIKKQCEKIMIVNFGQISHQIEFLNLDLEEMQHYVIDICSDTDSDVKGDEAVDAVLRWVNHEEGRVALLEELLQTFQLDRCSDEGIKAIMNTHEALLDKTPMVYKLLVNRLTKSIPKAIAQLLVVLGGDVDDKEANYQCWEVSQSGIVNFFEVPVTNLETRSSVCKIPRGLAITGGVGSCLCFVFIAATRSWFRLQDMLALRGCHGSVCVKNVLYVFGGIVGEYNDSSTPSFSVHSMVIDHGFWQSGPDMPQGVKFPKVSSINEDIYLLDVEDSHKLLHLDVDELVWNELAPLPVEGNCYGAGMTSARGRLFAAGGHNMICAWYSPETNTWCTGQQPLRLHRYGPLAYHKDKLLLLGGILKDSGTDEVEEYDFQKDAWRMCTYKMPKKIHLHHIVVLNMQPCD